MTDESDGPRTATLPGKARYGGYIYVLEFSNGTIKVGRTKNPRGRFATHKRSSNTFGIGLDRWWFSRLHNQWQENEEKLIGLARQLGTAHGDSSEYFAGIDFYTLVQKAEHLQFPHVDVVAEKAREEEIRELYVRHGGFRMHGLPEPALSQGKQADNYSEAIHKAVALLLGRQEDGRYQVPSLNPDEIPSLELIKDLAEITGRSLVEVASMNFIDLLEYIITTVVRTEAMELKTYAIQNSHDDLLRPLYPATP